MVDKQTENAVEEVIDNVPNIVNANTLYNAFIGMTNIERVKEEDFVFKQLLAGVPKNTICKQLKEKHPGYSFNHYDIEKFLTKNPDIVAAMGKKVESAVVRYYNSKEKLADKITQLAAYTESLIPQLREEADNKSAIAAIRAYKDILETYMKLEGYTRSDEGGHVINVVQQMSEGRSSSLKDRIHNANFINVKPVDDEDDLE